MRSLLSEIEPREKIILVALAFDAEPAPVAYPEIFEAFLMRAPDLYGLLLLLPVFGMR
jgi:hypothetical protein